MRKKSVYITLAPIFSFINIFCLVRITHCVLIRVYFQLLSPINLLSGKRGTFLSLTPLRTVLATFTAHGSSKSLTPTALVEIKI